jgi:TPR repeat protein
MKLISLLFAVIMMFCGCSQESKEPSLPSHIKKLIAKSDPINLHEAGVAYETGDGVPIDLVEAVKWYYRAAKKGNIHSHYAIWSLWEDFSGTELDPPFPMEQFEKSRKTAIVGYEKMLENQKDPELYYRLGLLYDPGIGIGGVEEEISKKYLRMAADMGHEEAKELINFIQEFDQSSR